MTIAVLLIAMFFAKTAHERTIAAWLYGSAEPAQTRVRIISQRSQLQVTSSVASPLRRYRDCGKIGRAHV